MAAQMVVEAAKGQKNRCELPADCVCAKFPLVLSCSCLYAFSGCSHQELHARGVNAQDCEGGLLTLLSWNLSPFCLFV